MHASTELHDRPACRVSVRHAAARRTNALVLIAALAACSAPPVPPATDASESGAVDAATDRTAPDVAIDDVAHDAIAEDSQPIDDARADAIDVASSDSDAAIDTSPDVDADAGLPPVDVHASDVVDAATADATSCVAPATACGSSCFDLQSDTNHCGDCGVVCTAPSNAAATCSAGACGFLCAAGYMRVGSGCVLRTPGSWRTLSSVVGAVANVFTAWTGREMLVWGDNRRAAFDPASGVWRTLPAAGAPSPRRSSSAAWTGQELIVWGGYDSNTGANLGDGARYDPVADHWTAMQGAGAPSPRYDATIGWAGDRLVVVGGYDGTALSDGAVYMPTLNQWQPLAASGLPPAARAMTVWTGSELIVWGGCASFSTGGPINCRVAGARYRPSTDSWRSMDVRNAPSAPGQAAFAWTSREFVVWGGATFGTTWAYFNDGARYDPTTDAWVALPSAGLTPRASMSGVWTGSEFVVWGGASATQALADGQRYDPVGNTWQVVSTLGAPSARQRQASVWTGTEMLVVGGMDDNGLRFDAFAWRP